jgi:hypothetical protein
MGHVARIWDLRAARSLKRSWMRATWQKVRYASTRVRSRPGSRESCSPEGFPQQSYERVPRRHLRPAEAGSVPAPAGCRQGCIAGGPDGPEASLGWAVPARRAALAEAARRCSSRVALQRTSAQDVPGRVRLSRCTSLAGVPTHRAPGRHTSGAGGASPARLQPGAPAPQRRWWGNMHHLQRW